MKPRLRNDVVGVHCREDCCARRQVPQIDRKTMPLDKIKLAAPLPHAVAQEVATIFASIAFAAAMSAFPPLVSPFLSLASPRP
jgi:hypothetical protein